MTFFYGCYLIFVSICLIQVIYDPLQGRALLCNQVTKHESLFSGIVSSRSLFWSTLLQDSNQRDNIGINSGLQWRYAQFSDLFIVFNENYSINELSPKF